VLPYTATREELEHSAKMVFDAILSGKVKTNIFKKYALAEARKAHEDLAARKFTGPVVLIP
jgi:NADPH:quinone reductase